jgi:hypothetical protein
MAGALVAASLLLSQRKRFARKNGARLKRFPS